MTVEQGLRKEFHDRPKVLARALRAAREQGTLNNEYDGIGSYKTFFLPETKEGRAYWAVVTRGNPHPDEYLPDGYVDVEDEEPKSNLFTHLQEEHGLTLLESELDEIRRIVKNEVSQTCQTDVSSSCSCGIPYVETKKSDIPYDTDDNVYYTDILIHHCPKCGNIDRIDEY